MTSVSAAGVSASCVWRSGGNGRGGVLPRSGVRERLQAPGHLILEQRHAADGCGDAAFEAGVQRERGERVAAERGEQAERDARRQRGAAGGLGEHPLDRPPRHSSARAARRRAVRESRGDRSGCGSAHAPRAARRRTRRARRASPPATAAPSARPTSARRHRRASASAPPSIVYIARSRGGRHLGDAAQHQDEDDVAGEADGEQRVVRCGRARSSPTRTPAPAA